MATIEKRTSKSGEISYRVLVRLRGHPTQGATFTRKTDAKRWATQTEVAIRNGRFFKTNEAGRRTVAELIDRYDKEVLALKSAHLRSYQQRHLRWWRGKLGAFFIADVTPALISELRSKLAAGTTHYKTRRTPATVNRYMVSISHVFTLAVREWEWASENPVSRVRKLPEPRGRVRFLSDDERANLLEACRSSRVKRLYPLVVLALSTGARQGELLGLDWKDVDLSRSMAIIHDSKNGDRRALPIRGHAKDVLTELSKVRRIETGKLFPGRHGKPIFPRVAWRNALAAADIKDFQFHDLRHSAASYRAMNGATLAEIAEVLGHKTLAMVKRYAHLTEQHTSDVVGRMNARSFGR